MCVRKREIEQKREREGENEGSVIVSFCVHMNVHAFNFVCTSKYAGIRVSLSSGAQVPQGQTEGLGAFNYCVAGKKLSLTHKHTHTHSQSANQPAETKSVENRFFLHVYLI